jgi:hypothetical protein
MGGSDKRARTNRSMRMKFEEIASALFPSVFGLPALVPVVPFAGSAGSVWTPRRDTTTLVREIDSLIGELLLGKRKKDVEEEEDLDDEEEEEEDDDLDEEDDDDFDDEDDEEFEEEFDDDDLDDDDDDIFYDDDDDE